MNRDLSFEPFCSAFQHHSDSAGDVALRMLGCWTVAGGFKHPRVKSGLTPPKIGDGLIPQKFEHQKPAKIGHTLI